LTNNPIPIETIDQAIAAMDLQIERCVASKDPCGYFAIVYRAVTARVRDGILAGEFEDGERMERLDVLFAQRYLDAVDGWRAGTSIPAVWQVAFETAASRRSLVAQHLLLGINAHINLDLGVATALASETADIDDLRNDFDRVNDVLAELVDRMQDVISSVSLSNKVIDVLGMRLDEALVTFTIRQTRDDAWDFATMLSRQSTANQPSLIEARDVEMAELARQIAKPRWPLRWVVAVAGVRERHDLERVVAEMAS
jgi:hypothetical protein